MKEKKQVASNNTNTKLQVNFKLSNGDLINVYADTQEELEKGLTSIQDLSTLISSVSQSLNGVARVIDIAKVAPSAPAASTAGPHQNADTVTTIAGGQIETVTDRYGNIWTYGLMDAPDLPDGRGKYAKKRGTSKQGKQYVGWFDPAKGPKPFKPGAVEAETIWAKA